MASSLWQLLAATRWGEGLCTAQKQKSHVILLMCFTWGRRDYIGLGSQHDGSVVKAIASKPRILRPEFDPWDATHKPWVLHKQTLFETLRETGEWEEIVLCFSRFWNRIWEQDIVRDPCPRKTKGRRNLIVVMEKFNCSCSSSRDCGQSAAHLGLCLWWKQLHLLAPDWTSPARHSCYLELRPTVRFPQQVFAHHSWLATVRG